ncbi:MAG: hypothetical protein IKP46_02970 [Bacteroidales bacterium]|nr:hypothetical protein [Bacteroidales bacterium]
MKKLLMLLFVGVALVACKKDVVRDDTPELYVIDDSEAAEAEFDALVSWKQATNSYLTLSANCIPMLTVLSGEKSIIEVDYTTIKASEVTFI